MDPYEVLREKHKPARTRVLFIGESRPANGTFFFCGDSQLARYTCEAFGPEGGPVQVMSSFLKHFQALGCFLVDLCPEPVNHLPPCQRRRAQKAGEPALATTLRELSPLAILVVMRAIAPSVARSAALAGADTTPRDVLPFPAQGHQRKYVGGLREIVLRLTHDGVLTS